MDALDVSRWQFGITTVYHFIFVPLTIGLAPLIAVMQTAWVVTDNPVWYRLTRFFGKLFLINFALGVATGIVQEFQFGMNWSEYSRFVGDVFGAPLAMEGLAAFFFESTFIGLWIFGWSRLPRLVHLACIWVVAIAVNMSAFFIIAANSWMQHPVGAVVNPDTGRAELTSIVALFTNNTAIAAFSHAVFGSFLTAGTFVAAVCAWWMVRAHRQGPETDAHTLYRPAAVLGCLVVLASTVGLVATGDIQGKLMFEQQPMKMASAESLCHSETDPHFSILTVGTHNNCDSVVHLIKVPYVLPFLAEGTFSGVHLEGVKDLQEQYQEKFGPGDYRPNLFVTYWSFRAMIGLLAVPVLFSLAVLWFTRGGRIPKSPWLSRFALVTLPTPFLANSAGWIFTEMGRQPWVVVPNPTGDQMIRLTVAEGVSGHDAGMVVLSLVTFTLVYAVLAVIWFWLIRRYVVEGPQEHDSEPVPPQPPGDDDMAPLSFAY
ncbi:cytochrome ubiquinol oxidase subunit I [Mycolicibacterium holsaticum]|uniref:cytochrome ubiquinol oxidase subunit I n=1 Tax=Mycolicibacterium holsaticum TaxID=152142 RepID=UPI001C7DF0FE|nr:cytochrome ubiquinol oxidase subunit I [Mycolicibacterium holsaticum]MDA4107154.1 cytochrome BD ubiquinol oxidase subunit I [Mycolicibacterium holsaticum DSM 44478 = JCM 12374]QZA10356.1 cytochrome ubiquinol oxidase subunit I [Mycolicibacterium holsaticum DSM 44478 = JCM 12374]UNC12139.1 cytochrome ubiquinol oxidase subunit I [Mycolicibacterium holsaticum DSM 44478 = JCM 12374]